MALGPGVIVTVARNFGVCVGVEVPALVGVFVGVLVLEGVKVAVWVGVAVRVGGDVREGPGVTVLVGTLKFGVWVGVFDGVGVFVGLGVAVCPKAGVARTTTRASEARARRVQDFIEVLLRRDGR